MHRNCNPHTIDMHQLHIRDQIEMIGFPARPGKEFSCSVNSSRHRNQGFIPAHCIIGVEACVPLCVEQALRAINEILEERLQNSGYVDHSMTIR